MTLTRNLGCATDDTFLVDKLKKIIVEHGITTLVETGVNEGKSTAVYATLVPKVVSIDIDPACIEQAVNRVGGSGAKNVEFHTGDSRDVLAKIMPDLDVAHTIFFLDAHWGDTDWPLPGEVAAVTRGQGVFVLHDIKVPDKDFGWDSYVIDGVSRPFEFHTVERHFKAWSSTFRMEYNTEAVQGPARRGVAFVYPS